MRCRITDMPITCGHRQLKVLREHIACRQVARGTLAVPPRQARLIALSSSNGPSGSGVCYAAGAWHSHSTWTPKTRPKPTTARRAILIAGGVGVGPIKFVAEALQKQGMRDVMKKTASKRTLIRIKPEKVVSWNHAKLGGVY